MLLIALALAVVTPSAENEAGAPAEQESNPINRGRVHVPIPSDHDMLNHTPGEVFAGVERELSRRERKAPRRTPSVEEMVTTKLTAGMAEIPPVDLTPVGAELAMRVAAEAEHARLQKQQAAASKREARFALGALTAALFGVVAGVAFAARKRKIL